MGKISFFGIKNHMSAAVRGGGAPGGSASGIDIKTDAEFSSCQSIFKAKVVHLKKKGKGTTEHKLEISPEDLQKTDKQ